MSAHPEFGGLDNATLGALVLELASQLHVERTRRLALEAVLSKRGILTAPVNDAAGEDAAFREEAEQGGGPRDPQAATRAVGITRRAGAASRRSTR